MKTKNNKFINEFGERMHIMFKKRNELIEKEDLIEKFRTLPNRKLSEIEKQMIFILVEKSKIKRERSMIILNKGFLIFFGFIIIASISQINDIVPQTYINLTFLLGVIVLIVSAVLYHTAISEEEKNLDKLLNSFLK